VEYQTEKRHYAHVDSPGHADYIKNMITGAAQMDGAILVVAATDGPMPQTREQCCCPPGRRSRDRGASTSATWLTMREILGAGRARGRELLSEYEFPGDDLPVIRVAALPALNGEADWRPAVMELMDASTTTSHSQSARLTSRS
jgi:elongation factor Tu